MPALQLLGRRWNVATDDIPAAALGPTIYHGAWTIILFVCWLVLDRGSGCDVPGRYTAALAGLGVSFLVSLVLGVWVIVEGLRGKPYAIALCASALLVSLSSCCIAARTFALVTLTISSVAPTAPECILYYLLKSCACRHDL